MLCPCLLSHTGSAGPLTSDFFPVIPVCGRYPLITSPGQHLPGPRGRGQLLPGPQCTHPSLSPPQWPSVPGVLRLQHDGLFLPSWHQLFGWCQVGVLHPVSDQGCPKTASAGIMWHVACYGAEPSGLPQDPGGPRPCVKVHSNASHVLPSDSASPQSPILEFHP